MTVELTINEPTSGANGSVAVSSAVFGRDFNEPLIHQVVTAYLAGGRQGTRAQKNRAAVRGGGAKPWRQKGSGRARAGTIRSNIFRGGGRAFPATTRDFSQKVNRKMYRAAMCSILSELVRQERLIVVDGLNIEQPKTRVLATLLSALNAPQSLLVLAENNANIELAARNLAGTEVCEARHIEPLSLIRYDKILVTADAIKQIDRALQ